MEMRKNWTVKSYDMSVNSKCLLVTNYEGLNTICNYYYSKNYKKGLNGNDVGIWKIKELNNLK